MKLLNITQLSEMINVKRKTIYDWVHKGQIPNVKIGRLVRFDLNEIERWIKGKKRNKIAEN